MRPIEKASSSLFDILRSKFSPVSMGDDQGQTTIDPAKAKFFSFSYKEQGRSTGSVVSISLLDNRALKVFYSASMIENIRYPKAWYDFLLELRIFAKRNLLTFEVRDVQRTLTGDDFEFLRTIDTPYDSGDISVTESKLYGSAKRSYQALENARVVINHRERIDDSVQGARARKIDSIFLERNDGERFKFPYNNLPGARAMARHVNEGGTPYDNIGQHIISVVKEVNDLSRFTRMTRKHAFEDEEAANIRERVRIALESKKRHVNKLSKKKKYNEFVESFTGDTVDADSGINLKEKFTRKIWDESMEDLLPTVNKALVETENSFREKINELARAVNENNFVLRLQNNEHYDNVISNTQFEDKDDMLRYIMSDISERAESDVAELANYIIEHLDSNELHEDGNNQLLQAGVRLAKIYVEDLKKMRKDPGYAESVRFVEEKQKNNNVNHFDQFVEWVDSVKTEFDEAAPRPPQPPRAPGGTQNTQSNNRIDPRNAEELGIDPNQARIIQDKLDRGQRLTADEEKIAGEVFKKVAQSNNPNRVGNVLGEKSISVDDDEFDDGFDIEDDEEEFVLESDNFTSDDINDLMKMDLNSAKTRAIELISGTESGRGMKPEKVKYFSNKIRSINSIDKLVKVMYDLLLAGEGHSVLGTSSSMDKSSYRKTFGESDEIDSSRNRTADQIKSDEIGLFVSTMMNLVTRYRRSQTKAADVYHDIMMKSRDDFTNWLEKTAVPIWEKHGYQEIGSHGWGKFQREFIDTYLKDTNELDMTNEMFGSKKKKTGPSDQRIRQVTDRNKRDDAENWGGKDYYGYRDDGSSKKKRIDRLGESDLADIKKLSGL